MESVAPREARRNATSRILHPFETHRVELRQGMGEVITSVMPKGVEHEILQMMEDANKKK